LGYLFESQNFDFEGKNILRIIVNDHPSLTFELVLKLLTNLSATATARFHSCCRGKTILKTNIKSNKDRYINILNDHNLV